MNYKRIEITKKTHPKEWALILKAFPNYRKRSANIVETLRELIDVKEKYDELIEAILLWAKTPGNHGGNPYCHSFMKLVPWEEEDL